VKTQVPFTHWSLVHELLSLQTIGVNMHCPFTQLSEVQLLLSLQI
jgi:hypothetical protein